ncbi:uncharacterized protein LOC131317861 isoform X2 [Rhododendron vialii]|uniref:uncharacterized protein LOC131317861 isoform X2 n=1 Tax=Rhododendron vialii TaxID=182163 RepID=UPI00265DB8A2|nr:uncharacterized protein LOC131317861 isoform X2 [Rhododendron vialii]
MEACDRDSAMDENVTGEDEDQVFMHLFALFEVRVLSRHAIGASGMSKWDYIMEHTGIHCDGSLRDSAMDENVTVEDEDQVSDHIPECKWNKEWDFILEHTNSHSLPGCQAKASLPTPRRIPEGLIPLSISGEPD